MITASFLFVVIALSVITAEAGECRHGACLFDGISISVQPFSIVAAAELSLLSSKVLWIHSVAWLCNLLS